MFEVVFDYGEHDPLHPKPDDDGVWLCRLDPFSNCRPGFEIRTYRLCRRIMMFHHFPDEAAVGRNCLVNESQLHYLETPAASFLNAYTFVGHLRTEDGMHHVQSLPPLEFEYSQPVIGRTVYEVDPESLENLPAGVNGAEIQWLDLDGEGLPGILTRQDGGWFYKRNESALVRDGEPAVRFAPSETLARIPAGVTSDAREWQWTDLAGDGQLDMVRWSSAGGGFYERTLQGGWEPLREFPSLPNLDWQDGALLFIDLTGDGRADVLIAEDQVFTWYPSHGEEGFAEAVRTPVPIDEERGPRLLHHSSGETIVLADFDGDGLTDIARIRNGQVCYWPNFGYGRFGAMIEMDHAPLFDTADQFDPSRLRLADIDGSGLTDLIYLGRDGARIWFNQAGNSWSEPQDVPGFPTAAQTDTVTVVDLLGSGTACLVWSSPQPAEGRSPMRYIPLMAEGKPHLLTRFRNNLGAETHIHYAPSTFFYLQDKRAGRPWLTKLPFPVHTVERVETIDRISGLRFTTRYAYHHGYYDGIEREFRGFGMVEQRDAELYAEEGESYAGAGMEPSLQLPPVYTKTWFHTGCYADHRHISDAFALYGGPDGKGEYYREPGLTDEQARALLLPDTMLPRGLSADEEREACRALRGSMLRQELYALDGSAKEPHPYSVVEQNFSVRVVQRRGTNRHGVYAVHPGELIRYEYERDPSDPRITHVLTIETDAYGNVRKEAAAAYGRRSPDPDLPAADQAVQARMFVTYTERKYTNSVGAEDAAGDHYRTPLIAETRTYELTGYVPTGPAGRLQFSDLAVHRDDAGDAELLVDEELAFEAEPTAGRQRRLTACERILYRRDDLTDLLPLGQVEPYALPGERYRLALTNGLIDRIFRKDDRSLLADAAAALGLPGGSGGAYVSSKSLQTLGLFPAADEVDGWWASAGRVYYSPGTDDTAADERAYARRHFFRTCRYRDPFHTADNPTEQKVVYDDYDLLEVESIDPLGNRITVGRRLPNGERDPDGGGMDYRVLKPRIVTDANGNRSAAAFDALGMVTGTAVMGKIGEHAGDSLDGFVPIVSEAETIEFLNQPLDDPQALLGRATTRVLYDWSAYLRTRHLPEPQPAVICTIERETHDSELEPNRKTGVRIGFTYRDGLGREIQQKIQAEPDAAGSAGSEPRWVGSGRIVVNNKGLPVLKYEPFFSGTHRYEADVSEGVSSVHFYDPLGRPVAVLRPDHTYEKTVCHPWRTVKYDANDTSAPRGTETGDPRSDPDIQGYAARYFERLAERFGTPWLTWHALRIDGKMGTAEKEAAEKAAAHANTPTAIHFDSLGRAFLTRVHNGYLTDDEETPILYDHRVEYDIAGNITAERDPVVQHGDELGRIVVKNAYDLLGNRVYSIHMDSGERRVLPDASGRPIRIWDDRGFAFRTEYDPLRRPLRVFAAGTDAEEPGRERLVERFVYGEQHPQAEARNLRGKCFLHLDSAGSTTVEQCDFKGNPLHVTRRLTKSYKVTVDWHDVDGTLPEHAADPVDLAVLGAALDSVLESEVFTSYTAYDALNREIRITTPHTSAMKPNVIRPHYNEADFMDRVEVQLNGAVDANGSPIWTPFVTKMVYNAKGQRLRTEYGNGVRTELEYDPLTYRITRLAATRLGTRFAEDCPDPPTAEWPGCRIRNLHFTYDPAGNLVRIRDAAQQAIFFRNKRVDPSASYTYDPLYRLIEATGREHLGQINGTPIPHSPHDGQRIGIDWSANDGSAMANYTERYVYDAVGNLLELRHLGAAGIAQWVRSFEYADASRIEDGSGASPMKTGNRLSRTHAGVGSTPDPYRYDAHGNLTRLPHLGGADPEPNLLWDCFDRLRCADLGGGGKVYYVYNAAGRRVRKVWEKSPGLIEERIYIGTMEIYRRRGADGTVNLERETLHVSADKQRIAMVETRTLDTAGDDPAPPQLIRYIFDNQNGSACLELDEQARIISYEEYSPFGSTVYQAVRSRTEAPKRYRFTGKERDQETGLYYHGARYYAPWLARWISCDDAEQVNRYCYVHNNPIRYDDPDGRDDNETMTRFWGALRMVGGALQVVGGAAALLAPEPTMVTKVVGGIAVVNGTDDFLTGMRQLISGREERGAIETAVTEAAAAAGADRETAEMIGSGASMALGFVGPTGGARVAANVVEEGAEASARFAARASQASEASRVSRAGRSASSRVSSAGSGSGASGSRPRQRTRSRSSGAASGDSAPASSAASGGSGGGSGSGVSGGTPPPDRIPDDVIDEALERIDRGEFTSSAMLDDLTNHAQSRAARAQAGLNGTTGQSAHISPQSAMRDLPQYDPRAAITRLMDQTRHRGFDDFWKRVFQARWHRTKDPTITAGELFEIVSDAARNNPHFTPDEAASIIELLRDELFVQMGLNYDSLLRAPYSR
jgi:RHS repeat-associated protein